MNVKGHLPVVGLGPSSEPIRLKVSVSTVVAFWGSHGSSLFSGTQVLVSAVFTENGKDEGCQCNDEDNDDQSYCVDVHFELCFVYSLEPELSLVQLSLRVES